jgi:competence CoiA-like predicted nuclease
MENCLYQSKIICTLDLKDENGLYYEELVLSWKEAAAERKLICQECGAYVYLAAGPIKEPYFAHYDAEACAYGNGNETEEHKKGKRLLYQLCKRSFLDCNIQARYRLENGMYSTLFCTDGVSSLAVEYRLQNNSLTKFQERDNYYTANNIFTLYILGKRQDKDTKQIDWYQSLVQSRMGYLAFLDTEKETLTLKKSIRYHLGKERRFANCIKKYQVKELKIDFQGEMLCDFLQECEKLRHKIEQEELSYQIDQERMKRLQEEKQKAEAQEQERMEAYRRGMKEEQIIALGLKPAIYYKCVALIKEGNASLVAKKYYDAIIRNLD